MQESNQILNIFGNLKLNQKLPNNFLLVGSQSDLEQKVLIIAQMLGCPRNRQCDGHCSHCWGITQKKYDFFLTLLPSTNVFKKEDLLPLFSWAQHIKNNSGCQVYHIPAVEKMSLAAGNSLLKFLETPQPHCFGILTTNNPQALLPTIQSRLQTFYLKSTIDFAHLKTQLDFPLTTQDELVLTSLNSNVYYLDQSFLKKQYLPGQKLINYFFTCLEQNYLFHFYLLENNQINNGQFWFFLELLIINLKLIITNPLFTNWKTILQKHQKKPFLFLDFCCQMFWQNQHFYQINKNNLNEKNAFLYWLDRMIMF